MSTLTTSPGHDSDGQLTEPLPSVPAAAPLLTGFAAGITGAVLLVAGVWGLHALSLGGVSAGSVVLLLAAFTALGKGITLLQRALAPIITAAAAPLSAVPPLVRALTATIAGAVGMWWVLRGHAASWWAQTTGTTEGWTLASALVQVAVIAAAGALLFGGAKSLAALWVRASGARHQGDAGADRPRGERWAAWWSSRPGLGLMLLAGAAAIVIFSGYIVPRVTGWLLGGDLKAALAAIVAVLAAGLVANTWWWGALSGWWAWAHRPHTPGGGVSPMSQMHAGAAVVALLWFSATAFGLAVPDSYSGPGAMPRARADCPPDCGGSGGSGSFGPDPSQFQPPQMPNPPSQYQGGANSGYPGPDQGNGVSLYNPATGQSGDPAQGGYPQYPQQGQPGPPANGVQPPNYDAPLQPQAPAPQQGAASPQQGSPPAQQAPAQQPGQAPQQPVQHPAGQQAPAQQGPQQPAQQSVQQPQNQPQPGQQNQPVHQGQPGQQNQPPQQVQQQPQNQQPTTPKKEPNSPVNPTDLAAAATRRGSQTAGQQATQTAGQQATQVTQQATQATQQSTQQATQTAQQPAQATQQQNTTPKPKQRTGFDEWANGEQGANESRRKTLDQMGNLLGSSGDGLSDAVKGAEEGSDLSRFAKGAKILKGIGPVGDIAGGVMDAVSGAKTPGDALGNTVSGMVGGAIGGALGSALGPLGTAAGSYLGNKVGQGLWDHRQGIIDAIKDPADAVSKIGGQMSGAVSALADNTASALGDGLKAVGNFLW